MLKIRLQRVGRKNDPSFRIIVTDSRKDSQSGKFIEILGSYDARKDRKEIKADRVNHWISVGAQVSDTVHNLLVDQKIISGKKINVLPKKTPVKKEKEEEVKSETAPEVASADTASKIEEAEPVAK